MKKLLLLLLSIWIGTNTVHAQGPADKFIPTYFIRYGGRSPVTHSPAITAKFDMAIVSNGFHLLWAENGLNSWQALKTYNPDMIIAIYQMGPGEYNTATWGAIGEGWDWIKENHGSASGAQRWTGTGHKYNYLASSAYANERIMYLGNPGWQKYWADNTYADRWGKNPENYIGADAIFCDNAQYEVIWKNQWYDELNVKNAAYKDHPVDYASSEGVYNNAKWRTDMRAFFNLTIPLFKSKPQPIKMIPNFGYMHTNPEYWTDLDSLDHPPFAAMDEAGFACPYSKTFSVWGWENKINTMKNLNNIAVIMQNHGRVPTGDGLDKMDVIMTEGNLGPSTGWDALWFSMTSFLLALNETKSNGYFGFTVWGYGEYHWFDEYDPEYLHLGKPLGDYFIPAAGPLKDVAFREYEDGWVVTNLVHSDPKTNVPVPGGKAWVVTHDNLRDPYAGSLVTKFDIGKNRGLILLKEGRKISNQDNINPK